jgi:hypothetical protein
MPIPKDDRDHPCAVARLTNRQLAWRSVGIKSFTKDELTKQEQQVTLNTEIAIAIAGGVLGWGLSVGFVQLFTSLNGSLLGNFLIPIISAIIVSTIVWFCTLTWVRHRAFPKIAGIYLQYGSCAGCGYSLNDLPVEEDHCIVCPECNAAWKADRVDAGNA